MERRTGKEESPEKRGFSAFDVFLVLLVALAVSLAVYLMLETPYGIANENPVYSLTLRGTLTDWEEDLVPAERQRLLHEDGTAGGRVIAVTVITDGGKKDLIVKCEWEGDLPEGKTFRMETADLVKIMRITDITVLTKETA